MAHADWVATGLGILRHRRGLVFAEFVPEDIPLGPKFVPQLRAVVRFLRFAVLSGSARLLFSS